MVTDIEGIDGGQGVVRRAERSTFDDDPVGYAGPVALKLLSDPTAERVRLVRERWSVLTQIRNRNLARALEVFEGPGLFSDVPPADSSNDVFYTAAAWIDGRPLQEVVPLSPHGAVRLANDLATGLRALHDAGLVHLDLHPGNVIVQPDGTAVLIDFGSVRPDDGTKTGTVSGVVSFTAPEQLTGTGRAPADVWGLGMLTVYALLGHPQGSTSREQLRVELRSALRGAGDPEGTVGLLCSMVAPAPEDRPRNVLACARELEALVTSGRRRRRRWAVVAAALALAAPAAGLAWTLRSGDAETPPPEPPADCPPPPPAPLGREALLTAEVERLAEGDCIDGRVDTYGDALVQRLQSVDGAPAGVVILSPTGVALRLTEPMWTSYHTIAGSTVTDAAAIFGGYPVRVERLEDPDAVVIALDKSGMIVGPRDDTLMFWIPKQVVGLWNDRGGHSGDLGFPTSNVYYDDHGLHMDFEHGTMDTAGEQIGDLAAIIEGAPVDAEVTLRDGRTLLGDISRLGGRIIRQQNGTAWWIDDRGRRHWIPDGGVWNCLGGDENLALNDLPGWALGPLPIADPATCRSEGGS